MNGILEKIESVMYNDEEFVTDDTLFRQMKESFEQVKNAEKVHFINELEACLKTEKIFKKMYMYTFLIQLTREKRYVNELIDLCEKCLWLKLETKYFVYNQIKSMSFNGKFDSDIKTKAKLQHFFEYIIDEYKKVIIESLEYIPKENRNDKLVIVFTEQMLSVSHGPTKSALGRCIALKKMGKEVLLINTAELLSKTGGFYTFDTKIGNYVEEFLEVETMEWKGFKVPYFQCENIMPNVEVIDYILNVIKRLKPGCIVSIGGDGVVVSLANEMIPALAISMVPSSIGITRCNFQTLGRKLTDKDREYLQLIGRDEERIVEHKFTSDLIEQEGETRKKDLGIEEHKFVVSIVGARLDMEITDELLEMMAYTVEKDKDILFMIIGTYKNEDRVKEKYSILKENVIFSGYIKDILGLYESCDLYINPKRVGGGTSSVEAMSKGLPVITTNYGDVAVNAGEAFLTDNYETMSELILKYKNDVGFYRLQSEIAAKRAEILLDTTKAFKTLMEEFERRSCVDEFKRFDEKQS